MKTKWTTIMLLFALCGNAFGQGLVRVFDDKKVDKLIDSVKNEKEFQNFAWNENTVKLWARELFKQYYNDKDAIVPFTEADYKALKNKADGYEMLKSQADRLRADSINIANQMTLLQAEVQEQRSQLETAQAEKTSLANSAADTEAARQTIDRMRADSAQMAKTIKALQQDLASSENKYAAYEAAFKEIRTTTEKGYENKQHPLTKMEWESLNAAVEKFDGAESLLKTNQVLYEELAPKAAEMRAWKEMKHALEEAVEYMKGKYNDATRTRLMADIDNAFSGAVLTEEQTKEKDAIRKALKNQKTIHDDYFGDLISFVEYRKSLSTSDAIKQVRNKMRENDLGAKANGVYSDYHKSYLGVLERIEEEIRKAEKANQEGKPEGTIADDDRLTEFLKIMQAEF